MSNQTPSPRRWYVAECAGCGKTHRTWSTWRSGRDYRRLKPTCPECHEPLVWKRLEPGAAAAALRLYYRNREKYALLGLTTFGTPRKRHENVPPGKFREKWLRQCWLNGYYRRRERYYAQGLTAWGTPRKHPIPQPSELEKQYRAFRDSLGIPPIADYLSPLERECI